MVKPVSYTHLDVYKRQGVTLAEKQTLVRNNGSEVQSLDPHKIEGVPESNISRDLFEGLLVLSLIHI